MINKIMLKTVAIKKSALRNVCFFLGSHLFFALSSILGVSLTAEAVVFQAESYSEFHDTTPGNAGGALRNDDVDIEATSDSGGGYNVGWIETTEWLSFNNLVIPTTGSYIIRLRVASPSGGNVSIDMNGGSIFLTDIAIPATGGWQNWTTVTSTVNMNAGTYVLGIYAASPGWNLNWIEIVPNTAATGKAVVYQHCDFGGWSVGLDPGSYNSAALSSRGFKDNDLSSIKVSAGYEVVLYQEDNFTGLSQVVTANDNCLVNEGFNDNVTSIIVRTTSNQLPGGRVNAIPIGIENVNDSPLKAANYRTLLRFVPINTISINRFYFGFKLRGANCWDAGLAGYGGGDGGLLRGALVEINPTTGLPSTQIAAETVNGCTRHNEAKAESNGSVPVFAWVNTPAVLEAGKMYGMVISNAHANPASNFFSFNAPLADTSLAGPHARNELNSNAIGALLSLDPREHVAWSENNGASWQYGSLNGQYRSYMNDRDTAHPATRMPQYGFRLTNGSNLGGQPYYAYSSDCSGCTVAFANARYTRTLTELGGFIASGTNVGTLTITNTATGLQSSCTPAQGYGFRTCTLSTPVTVYQGQTYTIRSSGSVEIMKLDYSQRLLFPQVGTSDGELRAYQPNPAAGTNAKDVPSLWAGPLSVYFPLVNGN